MDTYYFICHKTHKDKNLLDKYVVVVANTLKSACMEMLENYGWEVYFPYCKKEFREIQKSEPRTFLAKHIVTKQK